MRSVINKFFLIGCCVWGASVSHALTLSSAPLLLASQPIPNVMILLDDSGSMDWDILTTGHWPYCAYSSVSGVSCPTGKNTDGDFKIARNGAFRSYVSMYYNSDDDYPTNTCADPWNYAVNSCAPTVSDWRIFSADFNVLYYNPSQTYAPWNGPCFSNGAACSNASFTVARSNPTDTSLGYNVTRSLSGFLYTIWRDDHGFSGSSPTPTNSNNTPNGVVDLWDGHLNITVNAANVVVSATTYAPTNNLLTTTTITRATLTDMNACYNILGDKNTALSIFNSNSGYTGTNGPSCQSIPSLQRNIANWYQYHRKRSQVAKSAITSVVNQYPNMRYGLRFLNSATTVNMPAANVSDFTAQNTFLLRTLYTLPWQAVATPSRSALIKVGQYYAGAVANNPSPIISACQQNFTFFFTDGDWSAENISIGNVDGDPYANTLADVARYYYTQNLAPSLPAGQVPINAWDNNSNPHMVTYTMGFGINGKLIAGSNGWPSPALNYNSDWGNPNNSVAERVDDLWHAAFNSRGMYFNANSESAILTGLSSAFANISTRANSSMAAVGQNTTILQDSSHLYQANFDSGSWVSHLFSYGISDSGQLSALPSWDANCVLSGGTCLAPPLSVLPGISANNRVILSYDWSFNRAGGMAFRWPSNYTTFKNSSGGLPTNLSAFLQNAPYPATTSVAAQISANQLYGNQLLNYLRGDHSLELGRVNGVFRARNNGLLGDIVHSTPLYVGPPQRVYPDTLETQPYSSFKSTYATRSPIIYAGANDGMLHGFDANSGAEVMAYIPGATDIYAHLPSLASPYYNHQFFVDGEVTEADVFMRGAWKTVLVGGLNAGGKGVYALDISDPTAFLERNAASVVLWEFTDLDDPDLGYTFSKPSVVKMNNGRWAAIFGNGYNSTAGSAALYIVFLDKSSLSTWSLNNNYIKIPVSTSGNNGLSTPYVVDINQDFIADYIYAGDLQGGVWKFDVRSTDPNQWVVTTGKNGPPFFQAFKSSLGDQPLTSSVVVGPHPRGIWGNLSGVGGLLIYFGTGKYLESTDNATLNVPTQSFYAIWDRLDGSLPQKNRLLTQTILQEKTLSFTLSTGGSNTVSVRETSRNPILLDNSANHHDGWVLDLTVASLGNRGERVINKPSLRNGHVIFTTLLPTGFSCVSNGDSWLMEIDAYSGAGLNQSPFDFDKDESFSLSDLIPSINSTPQNPVTVAASGLKSTIGAISTPTIFLAADRRMEYKVTSGSSGNLAITSENPSSDKVGRQSWRQLK